MPRRWLPRLWMPPPLRTALVVPMGAILLAYLHQTQIRKNVNASHNWFLKRMIGHWTRS